MAEEIRRSGRATKGQYSKERDIPDETPAKKKGKGSKTKSTVQEPDEEENEIIRCVCGQYEEEEDNPRAMICCDNCSAWQHNDCMGLPEDYEVDKYFCEQCKPEDHQELLAAMERGEKPWEEIAARREAALAEESAKRKKRGKKGVARISEAPSRASEDLDTPARGAHKRKLEESPSGGDLKDIKKSRGTPGVDGGGRGRKASAMQTPSRQVSKSEPAAVMDISELKMPARKSVADNLVKLFIEQTNTAVQDHAYTVPVGSTVDEVGTQLGLALEHALYHTQNEGHGEPGDTYKAQARAIIFNVKKNASLRSRLLRGDLTPHGLAMMDPRDMASEEQQKRDAQIKKDMERQHTLPQDDGPRLRQTHKGLEYVDEAQQVAAESTTSNLPPRRQSTIDHDHAMASPDASISQSPTQTTTSKRDTPITISTHHRSRADPQRKSSTNFDIKNVWDSVQGSPDTDRQQQFPEIHSPSTLHPQQPRHTAGADAEIDALLKDEEPEQDQGMESPPYSPKAADDDSTVVWRGLVNGQALGRFHGEAFHAAGCLPSDLHLTWHQLIPAEIAIGGRIDPAKADEYLCGLQYSSTSDLIVVSLREPDVPHEKAQFNKLFNYFKSRNRYGVGVQHDLPAVKDIYLIPLEVGQGVPELLKLLDESNKKIPEAITQRTLLLPFVVKNTELPHVKGNNNSESTPTIQQTPMTPVGPEGVFDPHPQYSNPYGPNPAPVHANGHPAPPLQGLAPVPAPGVLPAYQPPHQHHNQHQHNYYPPPPGPGQTHSTPPPAAAYPSYPPSGVPAQSPAAIAAIQVLGPQLAAAPAVQQLIQQAPNASVLEMGVIKEIIELNPAAAADLAVLRGMLEGRTR